MSYFSQTLNELMQHNNSRSVDICNALQIKKSHFSKIKNGQVLPSHFSLVMGIAEVMMLNPTDRNLLYDSYKMSKFGVSCKKIEEAVQSIYRIKSASEALSTIGRDASEGLSNGGIIRGRASVTCAVCRIIENACDEINMVFQPEDTEILDSVRHALEIRKHDIPVNMLLYLDSRCHSGASPENIGIFSHVLPLLVFSDINVRCQYMNTAEHYMSRLFPFIVMSGKELVLISEDCSKAMYFSDAGTVELYTEKFVCMYRSASEFCAVYRDFRDFLDKFEELDRQNPSAEKNDVYIISKHPCIIFGGDSDMIYRYMVDFDNKSEIVRKYEKFIYSSAQNTKTEHIIFSEDGLREFFELEEYYEYNRQISQPVSKKTRTECYVRLLDYVEKNSFIEPNMLRHTLLDGSSAYMMNIWSDGKMLLMFNFENEYRIMTVSERSIVSAIIKYFDYLKEYGVMCGKKETIEKMRETAEKYVTDTAES